MLVYPTDSGLESWDFLNEVNTLQQGPTSQTNEFLRVVIRQPLPASDPTLIDMELEGNQVSIREGEGPYSMILRNLLGVDYARLTKHTGSRDQDTASNFFLLFPETAKREEYIVCRFLQEYQANVYSWQTEGAWDYFATYVQTGVILVSTKNPLVLGYSNKDVRLKGDFMSSI